MVGGGGAAWAAGVCRYAAKKYSLESALGAGAGTGTAGVNVRAAVSAAGTS